MTNASLLIHETSAQGTHTHLVFGLGKIDGKELLVAKAFFVCAIDSALGV